LTRRSLLVLSGGHPFDADGFAGLLGSLGGWEVTHLSHPAAEAAVAAGAAADADALLFYDMAGYTFADGTVTARPPDPRFVAALEARFASGRGAVLMHHALAAWGAWPGWSEIAGGRFLYQPGLLRGQAHSDSGYRHDVAYTAEVVADHPVTAGVPAYFDLVDELYLAPVFEAEVIPLVRARHDFAASGFYSAAHAVAGRMFDNSGWDHPRGSNLVGWARQHGPARIVYLQPGDGPPAYASAPLRRLLANALDWTAQNERVTA